MSDDKAGECVVDPAELARTMADVYSRSQRIAVDFARRHQRQLVSGDFDPLGVGDAFLRAMSEMSLDAVALTKANLDYWQDSVHLWHNAARRMLGDQVDPVIRPERGDRRFRSDAWNDHVLFDFVKQSYLLASRYVYSLLGAAHGIDDRIRDRIEFHTRQFVDALAPTNFVLTNPDVLKATIDSGGENLVLGLKHILEDLERGEGRLQIRMTDVDAFELGRNVATTPGKVVFQNELMQLLQYEPTTDKVCRRPLMIIPPWINKYYILDLRPENSFIRWAVGEGHTVFVLSWVNPDERLAAKSFEDYLLEGPMTALDAIGEATGEKEVNAIGYCLGGTLLAAQLALMTARGDRRIKSATFFTTMIDFSEPGELGVFIDEKQLEALERRMAERGYLEGAEMATTFNMLRSNDLIWSFVINNYLLGREPLAFDLLYWNSDSTRMPARMHSEYLRAMYLENRFCRPGGMVLAGVPIDITMIRTPSYFLSTVEDHIAPWKSTFSGAAMIGGSVRFVLGGSGHIAGVINPPAADKYCYWTSTGKPSGDPEAWLTDAAQNPGSWWSDWGTWVRRYCGARVAARRPGDGGLEVIEDAPGSYVQLRLDRPQRAAS